MRYHSTPLSGAYLIEVEKKGDDRGFFARFFCCEEFAKQGLESQFVQVNNSLSHPLATLRGLHYQLAPDEEVKLVRCIAGSVFDVILDLRPSSSTFGQSFGVELSAENRLTMYVPKGFAHGFFTLQKDSELLYLVSTPYSPLKERGIRWNDPYFAISWPGEPELISERDLRHPDFNPAYHLAGL